MRSLGRYTLNDFNWMTDISIKTQDHKRVSTADYRKGGWYARCAIVMILNDEIAVDYR